MYLRRDFDNTPNDWNSYWRRCDSCGRRYHASDGGCSYCEDDEPEPTESEESDEEEENE